MSVRRAWFAMILLTLLAVGFSGYGNDTARSAATNPSAAVAASPTRGATPTLTMPDIPATATTNYDPSIDTEEEAIALAVEYGRDLGATEVRVESVARVGEIWQVHLSGGPFMEESCEPPEPDWPDDGDGFDCPTHSDAFLTIVVGTGSVDPIQLFGPPP
jgi:hypothetical protein